MTHTQRILALLRSARWHSLKVYPPPPPNPAAERARELTRLHELLPMLANSAAAIAGMADVSADTRQRLLAETKAERERVEARIAELADVEQTMRGGGTVL